MKRDLTGKRFSYLYVIEDTGKRTCKGNIIWRCVCDCGNITEVRGSHLLSGNIKSCGCMHRCYGHGKTDTRLYNIWCTMKRRCLVSTSSGFYKYGARGITMCRDWVDSFESFYKWAMENGYSDSLSIDRIDNNGNYCPENCRWATIEEQANNKRTNHRITINNETKTVAEFARLYNIKPSAVYKRLRRGWTPEAALSTALGSSGR